MNGSCEMVISNFEADDGKVVWHELGYDVTDN